MIDIRRLGTKAAHRLAWWRGAAKRRHPIRPNIMKREVTGFDLKQIYCGWDEWLPLIVDELAKLHDKVIDLEYQLHRQKNPQIYTVGEKKLKALYKKWTAARTDMEWEDWLKEEFNIIPISDEDETP